MLLNLKFGGISILQHFLKNIAKIRAESASAATALVRDNPALKRVSDLVSGINSSIADQITKSYLKRASDAIEHTRNRATDLVNHGQSLNRAADLFSEK